MSVLREIPTRTRITSFAPHRDSSGAVPRARSSSEHRMERLKFQDKSLYLVMCVPKYMPNISQYDEVTSTRPFKQVHKSVKLLSFHLPSTCWEPFMRDRVCIITPPSGTSKRLQKASSHEQNSPAESACEKYPIISIESLWSKQPKDSCCNQEVCRVSWHVIYSIYKIKSSLR